MFIPCLVWNSGRDSGERKKEKCGKKAKPTACINKKKCKSENEGERLKGNKSIKVSAHSTIPACSGENKSNLYLFTLMCFPHKVAADHRDKEFLTDSSVARVSRGAGLFIGSWAVNFLLWGS